MAKWVEIRKGADFQSIGEKFGISSLTARLIRNKDITEESEIRQYLYGGLSDLCSASVMKGIIPAVEILQKKIKVPPFGSSETMTLMVYVPLTFFSGD